MNTHPARPIDEIVFVDGMFRVVFEEADGRQFVIDSDGNRVYGTWVYVDEPSIAPTGG